MSGRILTLVGADGSGKSTLAGRVCACVDTPAVYIYMGSNPAAFTHALPSTRIWLHVKRMLGRRVHDGGPPVVDAPRLPQTRLARAAHHLKSLAVLALRASDELYRLCLAEVYARRGYLVVLDRHPYADYYARRVKATRSRLRMGDRIHGFLLEHVYPRPRTLILLDAPAAVLHARKPEGSLEALEARRLEYVELAAELDAVEVVDATRPERVVLEDLLRIARGSSMSPA